MSTLVKASGGPVSVLTRNDIRKALREYAALYGDSFPQSAFAPSQAKRNGRPDLVERYYQRRADGSHWPSLNAIKSKYNGSWNDARKDAGFGPNSTGPASGRRPPGSAEPILTVRERLVYVSDDRLKALQRELILAKERAADSLARSRRLQLEVRELKSELARKPSERVIESAPKIKTVTKKVRIKDTRVADRLRTKLEDEQASHRATKDQLKSALKDRNALLDKYQERLLAASENLREGEESTRQWKAAEDRLKAVERRAERLKMELEEALAFNADVQERALAADLVRNAERKVEAAELRAAKAEREMAEQASAITGELRKLTVRELKELKVNGPAGHTIFAGAVKKVARAHSRGSKTELSAALYTAAKAAISWTERLT